MNFDPPIGKLRIVLAIVAGIGFMAYGAYSYNAQTSALNSPETVDATIASTSVEYDDTGKGYSYYPQATFEYTYEGETYTSSNVYPAGLQKGFGSREDARAILKGYEVGEPVTAYVPPNSPGKAYLKRQSSNKPYIALGAGTFLFLLGMYKALADEEIRQVFSMDNWV